MKNTKLQAIIREEVKAALGEQSNPELDRMVDRFVKGLATKYGYKDTDAVMAVFEALKRLNMIHSDVNYKAPLAEGGLNEASYTSQMNPDTLELYRDYAKRIDIFDRNAINNHQALDNAMTKDARVQKNNQKRLLQQALGWAITFAQEQER